MSRKARGFVALLWFCAGIYFAEKWEDFLLEHRGWGLILAAAWTLAFLAISGERIEGELRTRRFHMACIILIAVLGTLTATISFLYFSGVVTGFAIVMLAVQCVRQIGLYRQACRDLPPSTILRSD